HSTFPSACEELEQPGKIGYRIMDERGCIEDDDSSYLLWVSCRPSHANGTAPVMEDGDDVVRIHLTEQALKVLNVAFDGVIRRVTWLVGATEADMVDGDDAAGLRQALDKLSVEKAPGGVTVQAHECHPGVVWAFVDIRLLHATVVDEVAFPRKAPAEI